MREINISVRNLVELVLRSGDIDDSYRSSSSALEGTFAHQKLQKEYGENFKAEVSLKYSLVYNAFKLNLQGRADGIYDDGKRVLVQEIKSTNMDLSSLDQDYNLLHWAQSMVYGYIYMEEKNLRYIEIELVYFHLETETKKSFVKDFSKEDLEDFFFDLIDRYTSWAETTFKWLETRDESIKNLSFPFKDYRLNQRELMVNVYKTIENEKKIFINAPTGIGKTMSTIFPSVKAMGQGLSSKIFYLTAKTITREAPAQALELLSGSGLEIKSIILTAKEKICLNHEVKCNPEYCPYAKGHFDRVNNGIIDLFESENFFTRELIIEYSEKHKICPFEFSLDLSLYSDIVICDYNYVFDPQVQLKRFFEASKTDYIFLIDEAHNLVDRARSMYSAQLSYLELLEIEEIFRTLKDSNSKNILRNLNKLIDLFDLLGERAGKRDFYQAESIDDFYNIIRRLLSYLDKHLVETINKSEPSYEKILDFYFKILSYNKIQDFYDEHFSTSLQYEGRDSLVRINCIDPSYLLAETMAKVRGTILFSATLSPMDYYKDLLGGNGRDYHISMPSPFPLENRQVLVSNISTKFKDRPHTLEDILVLIEKFVRARKGNYLIFFPSYTYMEEAYDLFTSRWSYKTIIQDRTMSETEREDFLESFKLEDGLIAFAVLGGIFSEGIDLVGERLIGSCIVGVGMPKISFYNNMIKDYYEEFLGEGFDYAYTYPGLNKVLQGAGRVIRKTDDRGVILFIDSRYLQRRYLELLPREYSYFRLTNKHNIGNILNDFWNRGDDKLE